MASFDERSLARVQALQVLFQAEGVHRSVAAVLSGDYLVSDYDGEEIFVSTGPLLPWARELACGADAHRARLDGILRRLSVGWDLTRMTRVDRNLLRLALYELLYCEDAIPAVVTSEAVLLAKALSGANSHVFVNGILGAVVDELEDGADPLQVASEPRADVEAPASSDDCERVFETKSSLSGKARSD